MMAPPLLAQVIDDDTNNVHLGVGSKSSGNSEKNLFWRIIQNVNGVGYTAVLNMGCGSHLKCP